MKCKWHLCKNETNEIGPKSFCSSKCKSKHYVQKRRMHLKMLAVEYKGGKCELCGYNKCIDAFDFHHKNSLEKDFGISASGNTKSWNKIQKEIDKCLLLCANCHREAHYILKPTTYIVEEILNPSQKIKTPIQIVRAEKYKRLKEQPPDYKYIKPTKITWPSNEELAKLVWEKPRSTLAKELGVSDKAIAKHCEKNKIEQPGRGYWMKINKK